MKTLVFILVIAAALVGLSTQAHAHLEDYVPVDQCPPQGYEDTDLRCLAYRIKEGDTLSAIASFFTTKHHTVTVSLLKKANPSVKKDRIIAGRILAIPYVPRDALNQAKRMRALQEENQSLKQENEELAGAFADLISAAEDFEKENLRLMDEVRDASLRALWFENEASHLKAQNMALAKKLEASQEVYDKIREELKDLKKDVSLLVESDRTRDTHRAAAARENDSLRQERDRLQKELLGAMRGKDGYFSLMAIFFGMLLAVCLLWLWRYAKRLEKLGTLKRVNKNRKSGDAETNVS